MQSKTLIINLSIIYPCYLIKEMDTCFFSSLKTISNPWNHFTISKKPCILTRNYLLQQEKNEQLNSKTDKGFQQICFQGRYTNGQ